MLQLVTQSGASCERRTQNGSSLLAHYAHVTLRHWRVHCHCGIISPLAKDFPRGCNNLKTWNTTVSPGTARVGAGGAGSTTCAGIETTFATSHALDDCTQFCLNSQRGCTSCRRTPEGVFYRLERRVDVNTGGVLVAAPVHQRYLTTVYETRSFT